MYGRYHPVMRICLKNTPHLPKRTLLNKKWITSKDIWRHLTLSHYPHQQDSNIFNTIALKIF